ncbi:triose-phosphate isomerase [Phytomonospora endophytica]|uniref:Triosephosphate isomerase n=1 Tax=Phytomonospora endophytica TaxID=714109 RepID=A0A841FUI1_9ACTN|nr:triose-phosphate isomerase [Phytomonospora endophytica]MBB6035630.1 triosephosphate isomerase [Phytomonospora endophytica]GIG70007.1 triosephosphate isomerase [Phytomonospora endophytica]
MTKSTRRPLIAGNWKMNLNHFEALALVQKLAFSLDEKQLSDVEVVVLPPFTDLRSVQTLIDGDKLLIGYGAQDISEHKSGAYTGEIAGSMLAKLGCAYVVIGHSERREYHNEDDALVNRKVKAALDVELTPIVCVGEKLDVREAEGHIEHCHTQLDGALDGLKAEDVARIVVAYEPVWAIGTGRTATPEDAQEVIGALRARLAERHGDATATQVRILYGGSVKSTNVASIMAKADVDGALVGGASLDGDEFAALCRFPEHARLS